MSSAPKHSRTRRARSHPSARTPEVGQPSLTRPCRANPSITVTASGALPHRLNAELSARQHGGGQPR